METRITELLGITYPIIQAGMGYIAGWRMATAVSNAGGLGILGSALMNPEDLRKNIRMIRDSTERPFGVNIIELDPLRDELGKVVIEEKVPVISHGVGDPAWILSLSREYDGFRMPTVGSLRQALKVEQEGADAVVIQGTEGGGHTSSVASTVLVPLIASRVSIPVAAAGGFCDGRGLAAALALGADGIYMGTRFALTQESDLNDAMKQLYLETSEERTRTTTRVTGKRCRALDNRLIEIVETNREKMPWRKALANLFSMRRTTNVSLWKLLLSGRRMKEAYGFAWHELGDISFSGPRIKKGLIEGDNDMGFLPCGQVCGRIDSLLTCREVIEYTMDEAERVLKQLASAM